ncbi:MAG: phosphopyruvate hydratase [Candidatus Pacebacteria bacterium]|nr:phosphopyruvate hydratase [Candidatus Paceibacterota bacterium]
MAITIKGVEAFEILDSRGNPTVEVEMTAEIIKSFVINKTIKVKAQVPSGSSTGKHEAYELRDEDLGRYNGKGVKKAIENIENILSKVLIGLDPSKQQKIDRLMNALDGTKNKDNLGANAILGLSMAIARLGAIDKGQELYEYIATLADTKTKIPRPFFNIINGGQHAGNKLAFQEFMVSPNLGKYNDNYRAATEIYQALKKILEKKYGGVATLLGDEGGFAPDDLNDPKETLDLLMEAVKESGYRGRVDFALDVAASEFFENGRYNLGFKSSEDNFKTVDEMIELYLDLVRNYPIISIEDPFEENDYDAFAKLKDKLYGKRVRIVGDDLTATNPERINTAISKKSCDTLLLKINQIGTISEAIEAFKIAKTALWEVMVSHRSGETNDDFIADFSVGVGAGQVKFGAPARGERVLKYNRLLTILRDIIKKNQKD